MWSIFRARSMVKRRCRVALAAVTLAALVGAVWLVPGPHVMADGTGNTFKLVARHLRANVVPWTTRTQRHAGMRCSLGPLAAHPAGQQGRFSADHVGLGGNGPNW